MYAGDEAERASIARDIVWHVPGHNPVSGDYHGYQEFTQLMPSRMAPLTRWDFTLEAVMVNGNYVMTTFRLQGERKGKTIDHPRRPPDATDAGRQSRRGLGLCRRSGDLG